MFREEFLADHPDPLRFQFFPRFNASWILFDRTRFTSHPRRRRTLYPLFRETAENWDISQRNIYLWHKNFLPSRTYFHSCGGYFYKITPGRWKSIRSENTNPRKKGNIPRFPSNLLYNSDRRVASERGRTRRIPYLSYSWSPRSHQALPEVGETKWINWKSSAVAIASRKCWFNCRQSLLGLRFYDILINDDENFFTNFLTFKYKLS